MNIAAGNEIEIYRKVYSRYLIENMFSLYGNAKEKTWSRTCDDECKRS